MILISCRKLHNFSTDLHQLCRMYKITVKILELKSSNNFYLNDFLILFKSHSIMGLKITLKFNGNKSWELLLRLNYHDFLSFFI